jgi:hypothetical protein
MNSAGEPEGRSTPWGRVRDLLWAKSRSDVTCLGNAAAQKQPAFFLPADDVGE